MTAQTKGLLAAVGAYLCWGFMPLYWALFGGVRGWEVIGHRVLWSLILISAFLMLIGRFSEIFSTLRTFKKQPIQYFNLFAAAAIAAINWWINVYAATSNQVVELGIGMFLTPLFTVALGVVFFRERLSRLKQLRVFLPFLGVCIMIYTLGRMPWIALGVSSSWALYGVFKKRLGIDPWVSNALEASLMLPFAIAYLFYLDANGVGAFLAGGTYITILLISVGLVTSVPMIAFSAAANVLPLTILGFIQYMNPILTLIVGLVFFHEPFNHQQLIPLLFIWAGILTFIYSEFKEKAARKVQAARA